jgi:hypothetical protein
VLQSGGVNAFSSWKFLGWVVDVKAALDPIAGHPGCPPPENWLAAMAKKAPEDFKWGDPAWIRDTLVQEKYQDVEVNLFTHFTEYPSARKHIEDFWPLLKSMLAGMWGAEVMSKIGEQLQPALIEYFEKKYGVDQPFKHEYISILATGKKP